MIPFLSVFVALLPALLTPAEGALERLPFEALSARLERVAAEHPRLARLETLGRSAAGRALLALRLGTVEDDAAAPAILLVANLEGPRVFESSVALWHAEELVARYAEDDAVRALLDSTVVWVVPRANPDAAEARFATPLVERWSASHAGQAVDDDRDGRAGEDGPADVDGDGLVTSMRVPDPEGSWRASRAEPRVLVEADRDKGERGTWKLYTEARDADGDEEPGEDPADDVRVDRNFAAGWDARAPGAGAFPTSEPEARALCDFVLAQRGLALVVIYDGHDNLVEAPQSVKDDAPPVKRVPPPGLLESDAKRVLELGRRYREATGNAAKDGGEDDGGTFGRWCYEHRGLLTLEAVLWNLPDEAPAAEEADVRDEAGDDAGDTGDAQGGGDETDDAGDHDDGAADEAREPTEEMPADGKHLAWIDAVEDEAWRFVDWTPFEHPELGPVEIGGFAPWARLEPPLAEWSAIAANHLDWFVGLGELPARVELVECTREELAPGLWKVVAVVQNDGYLPLLSTSVKRTGTTRPARVVLELPEGATLLSGGPRRLVRELPGSGGRQELEWLVHAEAGAALRVAVDTDHAGLAARTAEVKP